MLFLVTSHELFDMDIFLPFDGAAVPACAPPPAASRHGFGLGLVLLLHLGALARELFPQVMYCPVMRRFQGIQEARPCANSFSCFWRRKSSSVSFEFRFI